MEGGNWLQSFQEKQKLFITCETMVSRVLASSSPWVKMYEMQNLPECIDLVPLSTNTSKKTKINLLFVLCRKVKN